MDVSKLEIPERLEALSRVTRYKQYPVMLYRSNLVMHGRRVSCLVQGLAEAVSTVLPHFDAKRASLLALVHDDIELYVGDVVAAIKIRMTPEERSELKKRERDSFALLVERFFEKDSEASCWYRNLLEEADACESPEAQLMKYADKLDGYGEALHELFAGNAQFNVRMQSDYGRLATPFEWYHNHFFNLPVPEYIGLLRDKRAHPLFAIPPLYDYAALAAQREPHSPNTVFQAKRHPHYDNWVWAIQRFGGQFDREALVVRKE